MARMTVTQASRAWGVARSTILKWIANGRLAERDFMREETPRGPVYWILRKEAPPHRPEAFAPIQRSSGAARAGARADEGSALVEADEAEAGDEAPAEPPARVPRRRFIR